MRKTSENQVRQNPAIVKPCQLLIHAHHSCAVTKSRGNRWNQITIRMGECLCVNLYPHTNLLLLQLCIVYIVNDSVFHFVSLGSV